MLKDQLKELRESRKLTKKQVADAINVSERAYITYEYGQRDISTDTLQKLADFYGVTTDYLLGREPDTSADAVITAAAQQYGLTSQQKGLLAAYLYMNDTDRENLLGIVKRLAEGAETAEDTKIVTRLFRKHLNKASAGAGYSLDNADNWETIRILDDPAADEADFIVEVDGDSMEPNYHSGDLVFVKLSQEVPMDNVGLFRKGETGYIKRRGADRIMSDNPEYEDIYPDTDPIECIGVVIGVAKQA